MEELKKTSDTTVNKHYFYDCLDFLVFIVLHCLISKRLISASTPGPSGVRETPSVILRTMKTFAEGMGKKTLPTPVNLHRWRMRKIPLCKLSRRRSALVHIQGRYSGPQRTGSVECEIIPSIQLIGDGDKPPPPRQRRRAS